MLLLITHLRTVRVLVGLSGLLDYMIIDCARQTNAGAARTDLEPCLPPLASRVLLNTICVFPCVATSSPLQGFVSVTAQGILFFFRPLSQLLYDPRCFDVIQFWKLPSEVLVPLSKETLLIRAVTTRRTIAVTAPEAVDNGHPLHDFTDRPETLV